METNLSETDITIEIIPNVSAKCLVQDCYAPIPGGNLYVEKFRNYGTIVTEPENSTTPNLIANCREHHMSLGGWHNRFSLSIKGKEIGKVSVSSACSAGWVTLD